MASLQCHAMPTAELMSTQNLKDVVKYVQIGPHFDEILEKETNNHLFRQLLMIPGSKLTK